MDIKFDREEFEKIIIKNHNLEGSDIHFGSGNKIGFRVMGKLKKQDEWGQLTGDQTKELYKTTLSYLQEDARNFVESEMKAHGHVGYAILVNDKYRFRVNAAKYNGGYYIVMRTLTSEPADLSTLGFSDEIFKGLSMAANKKAGLFLVVGPTGSGKLNILIKK